MADLHELRKLAIPGSLSRPIMMMGCDRVLLPVVSLFCVYIGFMLGLAQGKVSMLITSIVTWIICQTGLKKMGKIDPHLREVISRSMRYSNKPFIMDFFIPAKGTISTRTPYSGIKKGWL